MRGKFRKIAKKSNKRPKFKYMLTKKQTEKGLDEPMDQEKGLQNFEAINEAMKAVKLKKDEWTWWEESFWCSLAPTLPQG